MLSATLQKQIDTDDFLIMEGAMDAHVRHAIARMLEWCARDQQGATFMARGLVIDTLADIGEQLGHFFPARINIAPVLDDMAVAAAENAYKTRHRFQEITLDYIGNGKIPQAARANMQSFVKWYSVENSTDGNFDGHNKTLRPGWSGGAGAPIDMLRYLNLGTKKGFLLQVCALDIHDAKANTLLAGMAVPQAFGGSPTALLAVGAAIAKGGSEAVTASAVVEAMVEIKTIRTALINASDAIQAPLLAAALALKVEALSSQISTMKLSPVVRAEIVRTMEAIKTDLHARQIVQVVELLATSLPSVAGARAASEAPVAFRLPAEIASVVRNLQVASRAAVMSLRDAVALTMTREAPPAVAAAVKSMAVALARADLLPVLDRTLPPQAASLVRAALTQPTRQALMQTPVSLATLGQQIQAVAAMVPLLPTIKMAATVLDQSATAPSALRIANLQAVAENLQAVSLSAHVPIDVKPMIATIIAQVQVLVVQARTPEPMVQTKPISLLSQAPLAVLAKAVDLAPSVAIPLVADTVPPLPTIKMAAVALDHSATAPSALRVSALQAVAENLKVHTPPATTAQSPAPLAAASELAIARPAARSTAPTQTTETAAKTEPAKSDKPDKPQGGRCSRCFNKSCGTCGALNQVVIDSMLAEIAVFTKGKPESVPRPTMS